jgi:hypothetical protein
LRQDDHDRAILDDERYSLLEDEAWHDDIYACLHKMALPADVGAWTQHAVINLIIRECTSAASSVSSRLRDVPRAPPFFGGGVGCGGGNVLQVIGT